MEFRLDVFSLLIASLVASTVAIPSSLMDEIKSRDVKNNKVKRAQSSEQSAEDNSNNLDYYLKPTAIKRGVNMKIQGTDLPLSDWDRDQPIFRGNQYNMDNVQSGLFNSPDLSPDDKTLLDYEKAFRYGSNRDKLDEALENAVLKSELYGDPINQYRYYGPDDRRKKREARKLRLKRNIDLTPEEVLTLLTLYENNRQSPETENYRQPWTRYGKNAFLGDQSDEDNSEAWYDVPVYPHATMDNDFGPNYIPNYDNNGQQYDKKKRFLATKKRSSDPTRMLRYLNGPNENDFNTLSKVLNNQKDQSKFNVPVYRRLVL
ncbi:prohormone-2-like [Cylas formicarius]|uniref:prohormone-2-like n=1 Tax=Cylas formicarius TaxID=197179 RepID=UPI0029587E47|nr:prohormone-2-like [Cylas formicarius]